MRVLDLFSGIGGFSLGLERAGMTTVAFCEIEPFARRVLAKHWPEVPCYDDVRTLTGERLAADGLSRIDVICGGFPCQDISVAGKGAGLAGERSGLWTEYARIIEEVRPQYVIIENVAVLRSRGLDTVLRQLNALGYDAEWHCIPASAVGAPHRRDRVWVIAYACVAERWGQRPVGRQDRRDADIGGHGTQGLVADANGGGRREQGHVGGQAGDAGTGQSGDSSAVVDYAHNARCGKPEKGDARNGFFGKRQRDRSTIGGAGCEIPIPSRSRLALGEGTIRQWAHAATTGDGFWATEPDVGRVVDGPAAKVDRRKRLIALGNAVVPQIPELLGRAIMVQHQEARHAA